MKQSPEILRGFLRDFWSQTKPHPYIKSISLFCVENIPVVEFETGSSDGGIWFEKIHSWQEGHGYGSLALDWFCSLADKHQVEIRGSIYPPQSGKFDVEQLAAWYERHGFKVDGRQIFREPKVVPETQNHE